MVLMLLVLLLLVLMPLLLLLLIWNKWVAVGPSEFLAAVEAAAGSARDCGCSILLLLIELSGLPVAIKTVSAIAEVSRPTIEAAVYSGGEE
ncbi:uncharacterized protein LOC110270363 isoform X3 [Arachis ipaensis]|uniref:uncharacterized protein LOC110270363 isoform X3 n=1 Tax=Arachis ipaensis TaxID=130454 RepID=UPI000A2B4E45|nr:uncharacterized protein LOC110270363 isoform X3 [Arachis ipaensis]